MNLEERCISSENIYDGCLLHVRRDEIGLPDGGQSVREYIRLGRAVCIVPLTDDGRVILEHQYRYAVGRVITELPAGKLDTAEEDPLEGAKRELREETGADQVALTGGTFQNKILMEETLSLLRADGFEPYYNISVSPNDGGIALGQLFAAMHLNK